jgi:hypothetical protein
LFGAAPFGYFFLLLRKSTLAHLREINYEELKALVCENLLSKKFKQTEAHPTGMK